VERPAPTLEAPVPPPTLRPAGPTGQCPQCHVALPRGAQICRNCGLNLATGRPAAHAMAGTRTAARLRKSKWYESPYPYIGGVLLVLAVFDFLGQRNPVLKGVSGAMTILYMLVVTIVVLRAAKEEGLVHALLIWLIPPYARYFLLAVNKDKSLIALWASGWVAPGLLFALNPQFG
jgi:hypothetical protein